MISTRVFPFCTALVFTFQLLRAATLTVPQEFPTLQSAWDAAADGDTILVSPGTYEENLHFSFRSVVVASLFLESGDPGYIANTILDGGQNGTVVRLQQVGAGRQLWGFTIRNGNANDGGGIICDGATPEFHHLLITNNHAGRFGGGFMAIEGAAPLLENVEFLDNSAGNKGGALFSTDSSPHLREVIMRGNSAEYSAGAFHCQDGTPVCDRLTVCGNSSSRGGAFSFFRTHRIVFNNLTLFGNTAQLRGGGIYLYSECTLLFVNSIVWGNPAGGMVQEISLSPNYGSEDTLLFAHCDLAGGVADLDINDDTVVHYLEGNQDVHPQLNDPLNGDYFPHEGSPCIDAGTALFIWEGDTLVSIDPQDFDGGQPDQGSHEYHPYDGLDLPGKIPAAVITAAIHPNPFNPRTTLEYSLARSATVHLQLFDALGRSVGAARSLPTEPGTHRVILDGDGLASGTYFYLLETPHQSITGRLLLIR